MSVENSPKYTEHRRNVIAIDALQPTDRNAGSSFSGFDTGFFQVVADAGAPTAELYVWSDLAAKFIPAAPAFTRTGVTPEFEFSVQTAGRVFWVGITALGGATTIDIDVSGRLMGKP